MSLMNPIGVTGPVGMNWRGVWVASSNPAYNLRDVVRRPNVSTPTLGGQFYCLANNITSDPLVDTTNWIQVTADGATGATGAPGSLTIGLSGTTATAGNDTRVMNPDPPGMHGWIATSMRDREASSSTHPTSSTAYFQRLYLPSPATISNISYWCTTASISLTSLYVGLYNSSGTQLAVSTNEYSLGNAATAGSLITIPLSSSYSWAGGAGACLWVGYLPIGTTTPTLAATGTNAPPVDAGMATRNWSLMQWVSQSTLQSSWGTSPTQVTTASLWFALS